eukprot:g21627.t1
MVWTRAFALRDSLALVPYLDLFNHWIPSTREDPLWNCRLEEFEDAVGLATLVLRPKNLLPRRDHHLAQAREAAFSLLGFNLQAPLVFQLPSEVSRLRSLASILVLGLNSLEAWSLRARALAHSDSDPDRNPMTPMIYLTGRQQHESRQIICDWLWGAEKKLLESRASGSTFMALDEAVDAIIVEDKIGLPERVGALATALRNVFASEDFAPLGPAKTWPKMIAEVLTTAQWQGRPNCMEVEPAAIAMAEQLLKLQGKPCNTASQSEEGLRVKGPIREALAEQLQWEEKLEKDSFLLPISLAAKFASNGNVQSFTLISL